MHRVHTRPILEMNAALREKLLNGLDELIHERIELLARRARLPHTEVQGIAQVLLVIGAGIEIHRQQVLRRHSRAGGVQVPLPNWNSHPVRSQGAKAENPGAGGYTNEPDLV